MGWKWLLALVVLTGVGPYLAVSIGNHQQTEQLRRACPLAQEIQRQYAVTGTMPPAAAVSIPSGVTYEVHYDSRYSLTVATKHLHIVPSSSPYDSSSRPGMADDDSNPLGVGFTTSTWSFSLDARRPVESQAHNTCTATPTHPV